MIVLAALVLTLAPAGDGSIWDRLAQCESGGNWSYNGSSGFDGGLQFSPATWTAMGGPTQYAYQASRSQQIAVAQRLWEIQGWGAWPGCANKLGLWGSNPTNDSGRVDAQADAPEVDHSEEEAQAQTLAVESAVEEEPQDDAADEDQPAEDDSDDGGDQEALPVTRWASEGLTGSPSDVPAFRR